MDTTQQGTGEDVGEQPGTGAGAGEDGGFRRLRAVVEVVAGMLPGKDPEPSLTRRIPVFSDEWAAAGGECGTGQSVLLAERQGQALGYAQLLMLQQWNWVRVDWIWY